MAVKTYNVATQVASVTDEGFESSVGLPTFQVTAASAACAATTALDIVAWAGTDASTWGPCSVDVANLTAVDSLRSTTYHLSAVEV